MKTIVERLREFNPITRYGYFLACDDCMLRLSGEEAHLLADEIERCYIPRPRFEDGEIVKSGEDFVVGLCHGEELIADANFLVAALDGSCAYLLSDYGGYMEESSYRFKRPTPKVCDADGVEIKIGDELYSKTTGTKRPPVESIRRAGEKNKYGFSVSRDIVCYVESFGNGKEWDYTVNLTHQRPVFDAEGVRICKGDTVWDVRNPEYRSMTVEEVDQYRVLCSDGAPGKVAYKPEWLTHREPDSLEKLRDDMRETMTNSPDARFMDSSWVDRLTALIERGA